MKTFHWAVLGCGAIANELAAAMEQEGRALWGVANRTYDHALRFAEKYRVPHVYPTPQAMFADGQVDIVYIATPHNTHISYIEEALRHGKHVLCEKSITLNAAQLSRARALAEEKGLVLAEAMTIYHMPVYRELDRLIRTGALGRLQLVQVNFGSYKDYDMGNRFFNPSLAGGALLDIGVYALSFVRWFMSQAPRQVVSQVRLAPSGVDEQAGILLTNPAGEMAAVTLTLHAKQPKRGLAAFDRGYVELSAYPRADQAVITYTEDGRRETISAGRTEDALRYEIRDMEKAVSGAEDTMCLSYSADVMSVMTSLREAWGLVYPEERQSP